MLCCPMCQREVAVGETSCPRCRADLSLLTSLVRDVQAGLAQAETLTKQGSLGQAAWTYLAILETDPTQPTARHQLATLANAIRQFDASKAPPAPLPAPTLPSTAWLLALCAATAFGCVVGFLLAKYGT